MSPETVALLCDDLEVSPVLGHKRVGHQETVVSGGRHRDGESGK